MAAGDPSGVLLVDKPGGMTSHDVVSRARRALNTRRIGHAGTLDPMATGLLVLGVGPATRLLTYLVGLDKTYAATIRLGVSTDSDDADGDITATAAPAVVAALSPSSVDDAVARLRGPIAQVPSRVSAIKVAGRRAYDLARAGEEVTLAARDVVISRFDVLARRPGDGWLDLDVVVDCSSGTYIRALARDLGADLGVGGHLTVLRRTRIGPFEIASAVGIDDLAAAPLLSPAAVAASVMPAAPVSDDQARDLRHGKRVAGVGDRFAGERAAAIAHDGVLVGIVERRGADVKSVMNMPEEQAP